MAPRRPRTEPPGRCCCDGASGPVLAGYWQMVRALPRSGLRYMVPEPGNGISGSVLVGMGELDMRVGECHSLGAGMGSSRGMTSERCETGPGSRPSWPCISGRARVEREPSAQSFWNIKRQKASWKIRVCCGVLGYVIPRKIRCIYAAAPVPPAPFIRTRAASAPVHVYRDSAGDRKGDGGVG